MTDQTTVSEVITLPASRIFVAPENPRANDNIDKEDLEALARNIEAQGILNPLLGYMDDGNFYAVAGGRRTRAIDMLRNEGVIDEDAPIPVRIVTKEDATTIGIAEQVTHKGLTPLDTLRIFVQEPYRSMSIEELAKIVGMRPRFVAQRKAILDLPEEVVEAALEGKITVDQAEGLVSFKDVPDSVMAWFDRCKRDPAVTGKYIREAYSREWSSWDQSKWAKIVTVDEYRAAGGRLEDDLFGTSPRILNPDVLYEIAMKKIPDLVEGEHPGYAAYRQVDNLWNAPARHYGIEPEWSAEDANRYAEMCKRQDELEAGTDEEWENGGKDEFDKLDLELQEIDQRYKRVFPNELKALLEVHYTIEQYGGATFKALPNVLPKDLEPLYEAGFLDRPPKLSPTETDNHSEEDTGLPTAMQERIKDIRKHVAQQELMKDPKRVLALYCEHLAVQYGGGFVVAPMYASALDESLQFDVSPQWRKAEDLAAAPAEDVAKMGHADHVKVIAYRILNCITKGHPALDESDAGVIRKYWTPDEEFLRKYKKPQLLEMLSEVSNSADSNLKAGEMVALLADHATSDKTWLPTGF